MLNIPSSIKTLYLTDGVRKNFRAHFPNGEFSDITNESVVQESLKFTESLCSQSVFKFGLAEASVLEFETVGIGNMFGMTIEASIEIDTSSLSAAQISAIQADEGDGTLVLDSASDIGYGFYRIPLGTFLIESCPRNHETMTHRRVTAYATQLSVDMPFSPIEELKFLSWYNDYYADKFNIDVNRLIDASLGYFYPNALTEIGYTRFPLASFSDMAETVVSGTELLFTITKGSDTYTFSMYGSHSYKQFTNQTDGWLSPLCGLELDGLDTSGVTNFIKGILEDEDLDWTTAAIPTAVSELIPFPDNYDIFIASYTQAVPVIACGGRYGQTLMLVRAPAYNDIPSCYFMGNRGYVYIPKSYTLRVEKQGSWTRDYVFDIGNANPRIFQWNNAATNIYIDTPATETKMFDIRWNASSVTTSPWSHHTLPVEYYKLVNGYIELLGGFLSARRLGGYEFTRLKLSVDEDIGKHYSEAWWDEYDIAPIGKILLSYIDSTSGEIETALEIGAGASVYDMKDNEVLKGRSRTLAEVSTYINQTFVPNIGTAYFTPIEISFPFMPWLEAGDRINFQPADDSEEVDSYLLRVETTGIQNIFSHAVADGGEILTEV